MSKPTIGTTTTEKKDEQILKLAIEKATANGYHPEYCFLENEHHFNCIIFSHDFAKAFFGRTKLENPPTVTWAYENWQWELQQMVLEENPIRYLERFLNDKS